MKIAQVAPLHESVPPRTYGGTERVVSYLTEELVRQGHEITLFASGDSRTAAELIPVVAHALRTDPGCRDPLAHHMRLIDRVAQQAGAFDIIHFHTDYLHFPVMRHVKVPHVTTFHGRLDLPELQPLMRTFPEMPVVSISEHQRRPLLWANWQGTVHHGLPADLYTFRPEPGAYLAFLGRISPEKGVDRAIEIAVRAGLPLRIAAKIDAVDRAYFDEHIEPLLAHPLVTFLGEIDDREKDDFLGQARALLFPVDWPEPFGLVMIEAMACGTPVIAYRRGSVPEVMQEGETGFVVEDDREAIQAVGWLERIDRRRCRRVFEERFSARRMAEAYLQVYRTVRGHGPGPAAAA